MIFKIPKSQPNLFLYKIIDSDKSVFENKIKDKVSRVFTYLSYLILISKLVEYFVFNIYRRIVLRESITY